MWDIRGVGCAHTRHAWLRRFVAVAAPPPPVASIIVMPAPSSRPPAQGLAISIIGVGTSERGRRLEDAAKHCVELAVPREWVPNGDLDTIIGDTKLFFQTCRKFLGDLTRVVFKYLTEKPREPHTGVWVVVIDREGVVAMSEAGRTIIDVVTSVMMDVRDVRDGEPKYVWNVLFMKPNFRQLHDDKYMEKVVSDCREWSYRGPHTQMNTHVKSCIGYDEA